MTQEPGKIIPFFAACDEALKMDSEVGSCDVTRKKFVMSGAPSNG